MAAQTTWARRRRCGKSRVSWTLAAEGMAAKGMPSLETTTWYLVPALPRSVGLGPVSSPPCLARTEQLSTTTSQVVASGPERTIRIRTAWTWRNAAVPLQSSRRRRKVEPQARRRGPQLAPLHALVEEEAQRLDDLDRRHGRPSAPERPVLDPINDPRHQLHRPRPHARLPVPEAPEPRAGQQGAKSLALGQGSGNDALM